MPWISLFYGLIIRMLFMYTKQHNEVDIRRNIGSRRYFAE